MSRTKRNIAIGSGVIVVGLLIGASLLVVSNRYTINDWFTMRFSDSPSEQVVAIASRAGLNEYGKRIFFASKPLVSDANEFNTNCDRREASSPILGCYREKHIYIYAIPNQELDGIEEVTAAHEMLHAAWARMSSREHDRVGALLENAYEQVKTPELEERMGYYERQQPGERTNELHSILGTEVATLSPELEQHYSRYFSDRGAVVVLYDAYSGVLKALEEKAKALNAEIEQLAVELNADIDAYNIAVEQHNSTTQRHNNELSSVDQTSTQAVAAYNARQARLQAEQTRLDAVRASLDERSRVYETKLNEYNALVIRSQSLANSLDSYK